MRLQPQPVPLHTFRWEVSYLIVDIAHPFLLSTRTLCDDLGLQWSSTIFLLDAFAKTRRRLARGPRAESLDPCGYVGLVCFTCAIRHLFVVCTQTCIFRWCIVFRQLYADCMRCCMLVSVMLWYHVEIRDMWLRHMPQWDWYVLRPRVWTETSRSETVTHIRSYTFGSTIPSYMWYFIATPKVYYSCAIFKPSK